MRVIRVVFVLLLVGGVARADDVHRPAEVPGAWYGWQILGADALALGVLVASQTSVLPDRVAAVGVTSYLAGGPLIHGIHGRSGSALLSFGLRLLGPVVGLGAGLVAAGTFCSPSAAEQGDVISFGSCDSSALAYGTLGGMVAVSIIDAALAREARAGTEWRPSRSPPIALAPYFVPTTSGGSGGLVARF